MVYVDNAFIPFRRMVMCHMFADTIQELHDMADRIGMRRQWFQPFSFPHYDVAKGRRAEAVRLGAIVVGKREGVAIRKRLRASPAFMDDWARAARAHERSLC